MQVAAVDVSRSGSAGAVTVAGRDALSAPATPPNLDHVDQFMLELISGMSATPARDAAIYHLRTGGNRMRARLALASGAGRLDAQDTIAAAAACELLHNASLVHDDISDGDHCRRGKPTVCAVYGNDIALCAGDMLLASAFRAASRIDDAATARRLSAHLAEYAGRVIGGQSIELAGRQAAPAQYRFADYLRATREKTAPLIELALNAGTSRADGGGHAPALGRAVAEAIGLAYQILDDLDDLAGLTAGAWPGQLHALHAGWHHQPPGASDDLAATRRRSLRHVRAALGRAARLSGQLPAPLAADVAALIERLTAKAQRITRLTLSA